MNVSRGAHSGANLLVVGDRKQAIYTVRGADPRAFDTFADDVRALGGTEEQLEVSRRSTPSLVAGLNSVGGALFGDSYEPYRARVSASPFGGFFYSFFNASEAFPNHFDGFPNVASSLEEGYFIRHRVAYNFYAVN